MHGIFQVDTEEKKYPTPAPNARRVADEQGRAAMYKGVSGKGLHTACCALLASALLDVLAMQTFKNDGPMEGMRV